MCLTPSETGSLSIETQKGRKRRPGPLLFQTDSLLEVDSSPLRSLLRPTDPPQDLGVTTLLDCDGPSTLFTFF